MVFPLCRDDDQCIPHDGKMEMCHHASQLPNSVSALVAIFFAEPSANLYIEEPCDTSMSLSIST